MKQTLLDLFEILFPMREDARIVSKLSGSQLLELLRLYTNDGVISLLPFSETQVRACIHEVKFHENQKATELLGSVLHTYIVSLTDEILIVPIPLSKERRKERGYNQVELIAQIAVRHTRVKVETDALMRAKDTVPQTSLAKKERVKNVADAFSIRDTEYTKKKITGKHIILLDDVTTTGATLKAAKAALLPLNPTSITCVALAH